MKNLVKELYYGNVCPNERCGADNLEIKQIYNKIQKKRAEITRLLPDSQQGALTAYDDLLSELSSLYCEEYFENGFRLGAKLIINIFSKDA